MLRYIITGILVAALALIAVLATRHTPSVAAPDGAAPDGAAVEKTPSPAVTPRPTPPALKSPDAPDTAPDASAPVRLGAAAQRPGEVDLAHTLRLDVLSSWELFVEQAALSDAEAATVLRHLRRAQREYAEHRAITLAWLQDHAPLSADDQQAFRQRVKAQLHAMGSAWDHDLSTLLSASQYAAFRAAFPGGAYEFVSAEPFDL